MTVLGLWSESSSLKCRQYGHSQDNYELLANHYSTSEDHGLYFPAAPPRLIQGPDREVPGRDSFANSQ